MYRNSRYGSGSRWSRGRSGHPPVNRSEIPAKAQTRPLGVLLEEIKLSEVLGSAETLKITNPRYVASYNWLDGEKPAILVPGSPPAWTFTGVARQLREDSGTYFRDNNGARYPRHPIEPAIRALFEMQPEIDTGKIDLVACGSTVGNLLRFARGIDRTFHFDVEMVGNTAFFIRRENSPTEVIEDVRGYGHSFPEAYTTWDREVKGSVSHQRIMNYQIGGLDCLVRFESDGYLLENIPDEKLALKDTKDQNKAKGRGTLSSLVEEMGTTRVSRSTSVAEEGLEIKTQGRLVPQQAVFDLKTRSAKRPIDMEEILPRLWVSQTPNFLIGYHNRGSFDEIKIEDVREQVQVWEEGNKAALARLVTVIQQIIETAKDLDGKRLEVSRVDCEPLQLRMQVDSTSTALPPNLETEWTSRRGLGLESITPLQGESKAYGLQDKLRQATQDTSQHSSGAEDWNVETVEDGFASSEDEGKASEKDYTACSASNCGYCGHCEY